MRIFKWTPDFNPRIESSIALVWIRLPELPVHLFPKKGLFEIASLIGSPLKLDEPTADGFRPSMARVCVEIDLMKPRPASIWIGTEGKYFSQQVLYECCPKYCTQCRHLGHSIEECREGRRNNLGIWRNNPRGEKNTQVEDDENSDSDGVPNLEHVNGSGDVVIENNASQGGVREGLSGSDATDQNLIRTICVFEDEEGEQHAGMVERGGTGLILMKNAEDENEGSSLNLPRNEACLDLAADDEDFREARVRDRHLRGLSTGPTEL
ncbi:UNVERIFIED_CONTAM: hypothetical protein Sradi_2052500 [Sesamum radiatum]|uniref:DUF4283 domain-containing protein n=1 Tax=Sesamum radiatum TaxID=300843 RepID=A0AAW2THB0_SESRA